MNDPRQVTSIHTTTQIDRTSLDAHITRTFSLFLCRIHIRCLNEKKKRGDPEEEDRQRISFQVKKEYIHICIYIYIHVQM
jgi:hypothetical protein